MVLDLSGRELESSTLPRILLDLAWKGISPEISSVIIDGNKVSMNLKKPRTHGEPGNLRCLDPYVPPLSVSYSQDSGSKEGCLELGAPPSKTYHFIFQPSFGFHNLVSAIFAPGRLEEKALAAPKTLKTRVEYSTNPIIWRALPRDYLTHVIKFDFQGPFLRLYYPGEGIKLSHAIGVGLSKREEVLEFYKKKLESAHLVEWIGNPQGVLGRDYFRILKPDIWAYDSLEALEKITMLKPGGIEEKGFHEQWACLTIAGDLPRDIFPNFIRIFDRALDDIRVNGTIRGGNIFVNYSDRGHPKLTFSDATLEDAERFMSFGFLGSSLEMVEKDKSESYTLSEKI